MSWYAENPLMGIPGVAVQSIMVAVSMDPLEFG